MCCHASRDSLDLERDVELLMFDLGLPFMLVVFEESEGTSGDEDCWQRAP